MAQRSNEKATTLKITLWGVVQGVGFRPFTARLARKMNLTGRVANCGGTVEITVSGPAAAAALFAHNILSDPPEKAKIVDSRMEEVPFVSFDGFSIDESRSSGGVAVLSADLPVCEKCIKEMDDPHNRRWRHPFISCTDCGPRYSIMERLPYDRDTTTMEDFPLCPSCREEYEGAETRRYHAQTVSCHDCGPALLFRRDGGETEGESALEEAISVLKGGGLLAVKGIGGYHLACSPFDADACRRLREVKHRDGKPFAVMFPDPEQIRRFCALSQEEEKLLRSDARPIVLLERTGGAISDQVYRDSRFLGCFLPYTPLYHLLLRACGPLVLTSANLSGQPILHRDEPVLRFARGRLDGVLYHRRRIETGLDDCVARVVAGSPQFLRRGRGVTPLPVAVEGDTGPMFAAGGQLKSSFALSKSGGGSGSLVFLSQHLGDLDSLDAMDCYRENVARMRTLLDIVPARAVCDLHPDYETTRFAAGLGLPLTAVQHHVAHVTSVMAEHRLHRAIGVAFDGTGYGADGTVWGGEFLLVGPEGWRRAAHLATIEMPGGDESMKQAWKSALCHRISAGMESDDPRFPILRSAVAHRINTIPTSSMGRLFDAAASLLGVCQENSYEGECGIRLENLAARAMKEDVFPLDMAFVVSDGPTMTIDPSPVVRALAGGGTQAINPAAAALGFHRAVAEMTARVCRTLSEREKLKTVALSGGVFQNQVLAEWTVRLLEEDGLTVYLNRQVPPNDGGIALGQVYAAYLGLEKEIKIE